MPDYVDCEFPEAVKAGLIANGSNPVRAVVWKRENSVSYGIVSDDPSGEDGATERHLSVSASERGIGLRNPTTDEVTKAIEVVGLDPLKCDISKRNGLVHVFQPV